MAIVVLVAALLLVVVATAVALVLVDVVVTAVALVLVDVVVTAVAASVVVLVVAVALEGAKQLLGGTYIAASARDVTVVAVLQIRVRFPGMKQQLNPVQAHMKPANSTAPVVRSLRQIPRSGSTRGT